MMMSPPWAKKGTRDADGDAAAKAAEEGLKRESSGAGSLFHESESESEEDDEVREGSSGARQAWTVF